ncbi:cerebellin-1-like isoform X2 [Dreissena polymorpha]|uniref:cerebellin-1-like isoform X2 n=1 Tax=Dreissena polymorpha TaxID=45954 RepID=UPI00226562F8|nr:cerebellin-1-like isoform X2 [Dreissena polymorpha]
MRIKIVFSLIVLLTETVQSSDVDVIRKLAELDAKIVQLEKERKQDKNIIHNLQKSRKHDLNKMKKAMTQIMRQTQNGHEMVPFPAAFKKSIRQTELGMAAFTACQQTATQENLGAHQTVVFESVITNVGNSYYPNDGEFTAPINGVYAFHVTVMTEPNIYATLEIVVDGRRIDDMVADASVTHEYRSTAELWLLQLNKGSKVWIRTAAKGYRIHGNCHTVFSGFFVFET